VKLRDVMNGYALVKAAYPNKTLPNLVYEGDVSDMMEPLQKMKMSVMLLPFMSVEELESSSMK
jgi:hypothetical protein